MVNSVVVGFFAGLVLQTTGVSSLVVTLTVGATLGAVAMLIQSRRHRRSLDAYRPGGVDRAAIVVPEPQPAEAA